MPSQVSLGKEVKNIFGYTLKSALPMKTVIYRHAGIGFPITLKLHIIVFRVDSFLLNYFLITPAL